MKVYEDRIVFERDDFTDEQYNMLRMMFGMAEQMTYAMNDEPYYYRSFANTLFELCGKLGIQDLFY